MHLLVAMLTDVDEYCLSMMLLHNDVLVLLLNLLLAMGLMHFCFHLQQERGDMLHLITKFV